MNTNHAAAALPVGGGVRAKRCLAIGESWEIGPPFSRVVRRFGEEAEAGA